MEKKLILILTLSLGILINCAFAESTSFDFENDTAEGTQFVLGQTPTSITVVNFTLETVDDPALAHSGTKALVLVPGTDGMIVFERGVQNLQFYAADTQSGGRIELRDKLGHYMSQNGVVEGFPNSISPEVNPLQQSFVALSSVFSDTSDLQYTNGVKEIKIKNAGGRVSIDDLTFTYVEGPPNNTVYEDFHNLDGHPIFKVFVNRTKFTIGVSPYTAYFSDGIVTSIIYSSYSTAGRPFNHTYPLADSSGDQTAGSWQILDESMGIITFEETPAAKVQFYAAVGEEGDGRIDVYDTADNLLTSTDDIPLNISTEVEAFPFTYFSFVAEDLGAPGGIGKITYNNAASPQAQTGGFLTNIALDDIGFTPIGAPGSGTTATPTTPAVPAPEITTQPVSQSVTTGHPVTLSVEATGNDLTYQWYGGIHPDTNWPVAGATESTMTTGALGASTNFWVQVTNDGGTADSDTAAVTVTVPLVLTGSGTIAGEDIEHPNGNIFDQVLLTGESIKLQAKPGHITRVSFMDEDEDIVQVEYSGAGTFTVTLDSSTYLAAKAPPRYNQSGVAYVTGKPSVVIEGADSSTYFSIFTVGKINAVNQALFPEGQEYGAQADVTLLEVTNSTGMGGMQLSNAVFSGSTGKVGIDARGVPIAVRLTVGDIDASGDAVPHLLFGSGSFTVAAGNPGLRITGGDLAQTNAASVVVAESGSTTTGFETLISQNNFKSDHTAQPTLSIAATFANEDGDPITVTTEEKTVE